MADNKDSKSRLPLGSLAPPLDSGQEKGDSGQEDRNGMTISNNGDNDAPDWVAAAQKHLWLPYTQMKTVAPPLPAAATDGARIILADGRELVDGIASWWTACHGYNHPHIRAEVEAQLACLPHVMLGGLVTERVKLLTIKFLHNTP